MLGIRTLVLNNNFMPQSVFPLYHVPTEDALTRYLAGKCAIVCSYDKLVLTPSRDDLYWPSVIMNFNSEGFNNEVKLKRDTLFYRDHGICVYCEKPMTENTITFDHFVPKSKGGEHSWKNVVASCKGCNEKKGSQLGWKPKHHPYEPTFFQLLEQRKKFPLVVYDEQWIDFLPKWAGEIRVKKHKTL